MKLFQLQDRFLRLSRRFANRRGQPRDIMILSGGGLGDTILFAHAIEQFLSLAAPGEQVRLLLNRGSEKLGFLFPSQVVVQSIDFQRLRRDLGYRRVTMAELYKANFRLVIHTDHLRHPDMDEALAWACAAPETVAMEPRPWAKYTTRLNDNRQFYTRLFDSGPARKDKIRRWMEFAAWLREKPPTTTSLHLAPDRLPPATQEPTPLVVIHPYSAVKEKQPTPNLFSEIIALVPDDHTVVITGTFADRAANPAYEVLLSHPRVEFDGSDFQTLAGRLRSAALVISVDTACMHLAVAVGAQTLCLASAAYVGEIVPYDTAITPPNAHFIYQGMDCEGCLGDCHLPAERGMYPCIAQLPRDVILDFIRQRF